jgi:hypothetical protein
MKVRRLVPALAVCGMASLGPAGCGSVGSGGFAGNVGTYDPDGGLFLRPGDASSPGALDAHIEQNHITVTFVTVSCAGPCADVVAVATGGHAPYTFAWDDGSTSASRHLDPTRRETTRGTHGQAETCHEETNARGAAGRAGGRRSGSAPDVGTGRPRALRPMDARHRSTMAGRRARVGAHLGWGETLCGAGHPCRGEHHRGRAVTRLRRPGRGHEAGANRNRLEVRGRRLRRHGRGQERPRKLRCVRADGAPHVRRPRAPRNGRARTRENAGEHLRPGSSPSTAS